MKINQQIGQMELFLLFYIVLQPFLDVLAFFGIPISFIVRAGVMVIGVIYLFMQQDVRVKWGTIGYLILLGIFMLASTLNNYLLKSPYFLTQEATYGIKTMYVLEMLFVYTALFQTLRKRADWALVVRRIVWINMLIISFIMLLATITGTGMRSYGTPDKYGHSGWFFSANDLSASLAIGFGITIIYLLTQLKITIKWRLTPGILLIIWAMFTIGTKVGLGAVIMMLGVTLIGTIVKQIIHKNDWKIPLCVALLLLAAILYLPFSAIGHNMKLSFYQQPSMSEGQSTLHEKKEEIHITKRNVLSGRGQFLRHTYADFKEAPITQKLLGLGPGGNYTRDLKIIEMDVADWFFAYGVIGFIMLNAPLVYFFWAIVKGILIHHKWNIAIFLTGLTVVIGLGIAFVAGHILLNPASGIYLDIALAMLFTLTSREATS